MALKDLIHMIAKKFKSTNMFVCVQRFLRNLQYLQLLLFSKLKNSKSLNIEESILVKSTDFIIY